MKIGYNREDTDKYSKYCAVILAAGFSSRMKEFKPLLPVDGRSALEGLVETARGAGITDILVVTGHERQKLLPELSRLFVEEAYNPDYETGMFSSIRTGLAAAAEKYGNGAGCMIIPVDCPLISISTMRALMSAAERQSDKLFFVPTFEGKKGHPLLVKPAIVQEIIEYDGSNGLKGITDKYPDAMQRIEVHEETCIMDMDTPQAYDEIVAFASHGFQREKLEILTARRRIILVRHGQTVQHDEPMFIGQYDVPLSEEGRIQMKGTGMKLAEELRGFYDSDIKRDFFGNAMGTDMPHWSNMVYASDLSRSRESAEIIAACLEREGLIVEDEENGVKGEHVVVKTLKNLREIDLGEWDGKPVRQIRENHPDDYARRGEDLFVFKTGNKAENFYDLQYRAIRALREIIASDDGRNIIIVAHSGIIRALANNLKGLRVDDAWEKVEKGQFIIIQM